MKILPQLQSFQYMQNFGSKNGRKEKRLQERASDNTAISEMQEKIHPMETFLRKYLSWQTN